MGRIALTIYRHNHRWPEIGDITTDGLWFNTLLRLYFYLLCAGLVRPCWGLYVWGLYIRRPSLPTVHFDGGGARVLVLRHCSPLYLPLDYELREILYHTNKYSNILQSLTILFLDLGIIRLGIIHPPSIFTYGPFLRRGLPGSWFYVLLRSSTLYSPFGLWTPRDFRCMY